MNCKNCQTELSEHDDYCKSCGGKVIRNRLTIKNLFVHFSETFFNYDNTLLQTFISLFSKPEIVIGSYINGTRKKYVNVVSYFAIAITISGFQLLIINKYFPEVYDFSIESMKGQADFQKKNMAVLQEYQSIVMMLYVPLYAIMAKIIFFNLKTYNYTELLVVFMYIQAQISIASALLVLVLALVGLSSNIIGMAMIPLMILYAAYCLKRLYHLNLLDIIVRTLFFFVILGIVMVIATIIMLGVMYLNGDLQEIFEAGKKAAEEAAKKQATN
ncbi:hypothetical protein ADIWIN_2430 [Winogradskyella psychrotolerans RS-3]|uniref:DUF3667 domain-containing protein n=1 Tax=Winogradskyella psychrotolerans RS-3 TaxID=641526 RepID=S7VQL2_9FLAO|nr:DUF3667 domain-containing protein [Winogradskyella psychrotolerans]EPR72540.1 hypothetical protein ADIWIN_2430 [Winogradskyella psychrotolerans RS-3]